MSIFKRLSATLVSRIDQVVGEIENHDAVIQVTLDDMRKKVAEAKVSLGQMRREEAHLKRQLEEQQKSAQQWRQRAVESAKSDEAKALECMRRSRHCQQQADRLGDALAQYQQTSTKLAHDIETSEQRLGEMKQKQALMRARQSSSAALIATDTQYNDSSRLLDDTFDRWDINVTQAEMLFDTELPTDPIEQEFSDRELQDELRHELARLLAEEEQK
jgi:phage shock protein A